MRLVVVRILGISFAIAGGCAGEVQFANRAILWHDPDDRPIPKPPQRRNAEVNWQGMRDTVFRPAQRFFAADYLTEAVNVNALDEVPDSTWFTNRRRDPSSPDDQPRWVPLGPEVVERGAITEGDVPVPPFTVLREKTEGSTLGLIVKDSRGVKYQLKFDRPENPGLVTSSEVIATRLAWAAGWNVAPEMLIDINPADLHLAPDAATADRFDRRRPLTADALDELVQHVEQGGRVRAVASRWLEGHVIGWSSYLGREKNDPNDRYDHQHRRDLRGFGVWAAWVDDVDTFDNNSLDVYRGDPGHGHVVHYQQGVGASFGHFAAQPIEYWMGRQPYFAPGSVIGSIASFGLASRPWQDSRLERKHAQSMIEWPELGFYSADSFDPRKWRPVADNAAFVRQTRRDRYWGAKQVAAFTADEIRAAIRAGRFEPVVAEHLFEVLWKRRERIARTYFSDVAPLDHFRFDGNRLCFDDLWIDAGLGGESGTRYEATERTLATGSSKPRRTWREVAGRCVALPARSGYRIVELRALRPGDRRVGPMVEVHLVDGAGSDARHIVGVRR